MDDVVSTFPLLRLPNKAILNTLRIMTHLEILGISLLSKKTKHLVESVKITTICFEVDVTAYFEVVLYFPNHKKLQFQLYHVRENKPLQELETPENVYIICENQMLTLRNWISVKNLLDHLQLVFHSSITSLSLFLHWERFNVDSICRIIKKVESFSVYSENQENNRKVLSSIQAAKLNIWSFSDEYIIPRNVLIQNMDVICAPGVQKTLDELLTTNVRGIEMSCRRLSVKVFNQFLKLWINGSNNRLEWVNLSLHENSQNEDFLRGLEYQDASRNEERIFKYWGDRAPMIVIGGWNIWRFDGTQATVTISGDLVSLFVWHDHCILNLTNP